MMGAESRIFANLAVADEVRELSPNVIQKLLRLGIKKTIMLTGDNNRTAHAVGKRLGRKRYSSRALATR